VYRKPVAHLLTEMSAGHAQWMTTEERERETEWSACAQLQPQIQVPSTELTMQLCHHQQQQQQISSA